LVAAGADKPDQPYPEFKDVTKDMVSKEGMFTLWSYPADAKDKDTEKLLAQIPSALLGQKIMLSTSVAGGGYFTGFPLDERVVEMQILDKQLLFVQPETHYVTDQSDVSDAVKRTYPDSIRVAVPIVTKSPGGDPVIDLGTLLKSDFADIGWMSMADAMFGGGMGGGINATLSKWTKKKSFPQNVEIGVELAMGAGSPPGSYDKKAVHFSFWKLPDTGYQPRVADDRVGYFLTTNTDWSKPTESRDLFNRYVNRWQLEKRDTSLGACEPKTPIVYYIEKTVPVRFRRAVRDGILEWNKAFEKVGFLNAVEVRQQTDDNEWRDLDPEDMRYSFFRWIVTGGGFAMGPSRANPFTGQIYDADIIFDDSMVRYFEQSAQQMLPAAYAATKFEDPTLETFVEKFPQFKRPTADWEQVAIGQDKQIRERAALKHRLRERGMHCCEYTEGMKHQMAVAQAVLGGQPKEVIDRFLYDTIKEVVAHEVGHTLGLRHNFKASSVFSVDEIQKRRATKEPTCGSVMDYNPVLFFAKNSTDGFFVTPSIGPYDMWAIEYGYRVFDSSYKSPEGSKDDKKKEDEKKADEQVAKTAAAAATPAATVVAQGNIDLSQIPKEVLDQLPPEVKKALAEGKIAAGNDPNAGAAAAAAGDSKPGFAAPPAGEEAMLKEIAGRSTEPELAYATDEDTTFLAPDPTVNRFDMSSDPMAWAEARMEVVDQRLANILDWAVKDGESWYHIRGSFQSLMYERLVLLDYVGRFIGGQYFSRVHRGDKNETAPFTLVDPATQRKAMAFVADHVFTDKFFVLSPDVLNHLAPSRWWHDGTNISLTMDYPVRSTVAMFQWWTLFDRFFPNNLRRIHDAELKSTADDKFTLAEYLQTLQDKCWGDALDGARVTAGAYTNAKPFINDVRRSLQREYLGAVEPLVRTAPGTVISPDIHAMIRFSLSELSNKLGEVSKNQNLDFTSRAHLAECKSRIDRMLSPELREYASVRMGGGGM
jgi:hypothetical protein